MWTPFNAYLISREPMQVANRKNALTFPFNIRHTLTFWNLVILPGKSASGISGQGAMTNQMAPPLFRAVHDLAMIWTHCLPICSIWTRHPTSPFRHARRSQSPWFQHLPPQHMPHISLCVPLAMVLKCRASPRWLYAVNRRLASVERCSQSGAYGASRYSCSKIPRGFRAWSLCPPSRTKLTDQQVADLANWMRAVWGGRKPTFESGEAGIIRHSI